MANADTSLKALTLKRSYRSDEDHLVEHFYIPCLMRAQRYSRAVGFFSSSGLAAAAKGLNTFARQGGTMRLVASPHLSREDIEQIIHGYRSRDDVIEGALLRALNVDMDSAASTRLGFLAWLIHQQVLDIKIAICKDLSRYGIYHEKVGVFHDAEGNFVSFTGSANESASGLVCNFECIDVFPSWSDQLSDFAEDKRRNFERLWEADTPNLEIRSFPDAAREGLLKFRQSTMPEYDPEVESVNIPKGRPFIPSSKTLRGYQEEAIRNWFMAQGRGIFKMATGSGKTVTALGAATRLHDKAHVPAFIVICPYKHLVTQWDRTATEFNFAPILCFESRSDWQPLLMTALMSQRGEGDPPLMVLTTNATFSGDAFQACLEKFPRNTLIIADEMHNLGAENLKRSLPEGPRYRLGLSATPERWYDDEGTEALYDYFGKVLKPEFTLKMAINAKALVQYYYHPIVVELTPSEEEEYLKLSAQIAQAMGASKNNADLGDIPNYLAIKRARLIAMAENKLGKLRELMESKRTGSHMLFYCGDGSVDVPEDESEIRHIDAVCRLLGTDLGMRVHPYIAETSLEDRDKLRIRFRDGDLQGLVAIRCLDEGVDIPEIRTSVILASSSNPRQFIQRRGRLLRTCAGKRHAEIYDMIVVPPQDIEKEDAVFNLERRLLKREMGRFLEFSELALNGPEARLALQPTLERYHLLDL